jgi:hypothetical protein
MRNYWKGTRTALLARNQASPQILLLRRNAAAGVMERARENVGIAAAAENANVIGARRGIMTSGQTGAAAEAGAETDGIGTHMGSGGYPSLPIVA